MAASKKPLAKQHKTVVGKILNKESGTGIPNLLIVISSDQQTKSKKTNARKSTASGNASRLGSVLTDNNGAFKLTYDAVLVPFTKQTLLLTVCAAENSGAAQENILHTSPFRNNAGSVESYLIKLETTVLKRAGINVDEAASPEVLIKKYKSSQEFNNKVNADVTAARKVQVDTTTTEFKAFRKTIMKSLLPAGIPGRIENEGDEGGNISDRMITAVTRGIDSVNSHARGTAINLYLTPDDLGVLKPYFDRAVDGIVEIPENVIRPIRFRQTGSDNPGTLLIHNNPIAKYCLDKTKIEKCAIEHLDSDGSDSGGSGSTKHHHTDSTATHASENGSGDIIATGKSLSVDDIKEYINKIISNISSPDQVLNPNAIPVRPDKESIQVAVNTFSLQNGPAEVPAYYDFHSLNIAFEHVWQQLFDERIVTTSFEVRSKLGPRGIDFDLSTINPDAIRAIVTALELVPVNVAAQFEITKEEWSDLSFDLQERLKEIAAQLNAILYKRVHTMEPPSWPGGDDRNSYTFVPNSLSLSGEKLKQALIEQGEKIIDSVRHDDYYTLHKTLRDLQARLQSKYQYTVFAADKDNCSVNFGILNTFRQEWLPLNYQVGELIKTIPLAPKEERKYDVKFKNQEKTLMKDVHKLDTTTTFEQSVNTRAEDEIIKKAHTNTNFTLTANGEYDLWLAEGTSSTGLTVDAGTDSDETKKSFREAVLKATQQFKDERTIEVSTDFNAEYERGESGTIVNPNDELAVTYLFYELQRRYRISEQLYRVAPVVLVAQPVPKPHELTEAWVVAHDWMIRRHLRDESFRPALEYLAMKSVGDDFSIRELRRNLRQQRNLVETLKLELSFARIEANNRYRALETSIKNRIDEESGENTDGVVQDVWDWFSGESFDPEAAKARELAAQDAHRYAVEKAEKMAAALRQEIDSLHKLTTDFNKALKDHLDNEARIKRLLVHIRDNIIYYMQAIWSMEAPDQRFLRLRNVRVPHLQLDGPLTYSLEATVSEDVFAPFRLAGTERHKATIKGKLKKPFTYKPLIEVASLDKPLGFKGNYMVFPMVEHNALTELMSAPYVDHAFGAMDPDELSNVTINDFSNFICCLHKHDKEKFTDLKPYLQKWLNKLLSEPLRNGDEVVIPSGSIYIEALPATHPILEDFKLRHRELDVFKVQAEVRKMELENLRYAARLLSNELEDPEVEKKIVLEGNGEALVHTE